MTKPSPEDSKEDNQKVDIALNENKKYFKKLKKNKDNDHIKNDLDNKKKDELNEIKNTDLIEKSEADAENYQSKKFLDEITKKKEHINSPVIEVRTGTPKVLSKLDVTTAIQPKDFQNSKKLNRKN